MSVRLNHEAGQMRERERYIQHISIQFVFVRSDNMCKAHLNHINISL
jgi:hypothetical protein